MLKLLAAALFLLLPGAASALETIETGLIGSPNAGAWPYYIGIDEGMFDKAGIKLDLIYVPTAPGLVQEAASGSLDLVGTIGLVEPIHARAKGAPVAILRILSDVTPYEMMGQKDIGRIEDLRGKTICIGGLVDINRVYLDRIMTAYGLKDGDYDIVVIGNTAQRFAALQSGTVQATMLVPPVNFIAEKRGFTNLGLIMDYTKDLPMGGAVVNVAWAQKHEAAAKAIAGVLDQAVAWFYDDRNRDAAIDLLAKRARSDRAEIVESYDFLRRIGQFERSNAVSKTRVDNLIKAMRAIGDMKDATVTTDQLVIAGLTPVAP